MTQVIGITLRIKHEPHYMEVSVEDHVSYEDLIEIVNNAIKINMDGNINIKTKFEKAKGEK